MKKNKSWIVIVVLLLLLIIGVCLLFFLRGDKDPVSTDTPKQEVDVKSQESDINASEYAEYDWQNEADETKDKDVSFNSIKGNTDTGEDGSSDEDTGKLRHDESKNTGIEVEFDSWAE